MPTEAVVLAVAGPLAVAVAWLVVRSGRASVWVANGALMPVLGVLSLLTGVVEDSELGVWWGAFLGVAAGVGLYAATAAFMAVAGRWPLLARHTSSLYENTRDISVPTAVAVSALLVAPGEELLWRGVVLEVIRSEVDPLLLAGVVVWALYIVANVVSGSVPIVLGAVVAGAVWTALAILTEGVVASIACHVVWTALMVAAPPVPRRR